MLAFRASFSLGNRMRPHGVGFAGSNFSTRSRFASGPPLPRPTSRPGEKARRACSPRSWCRGWYRATDRRPRASGQGRGCAGDRQGNGKRPQGTHPLSLILRPAPPPRRRRLGPRTCRLRPAGRFRARSPRRRRADRLLPRSRSLRSARRRRHVRRRRR